MDSCNRTRTNTLSFFVATLFVGAALNLFAATYAFAWDEQAAMKRARSESSALLHNNEIYVFNGFGRRIDIENSVEKYNPNSKTWSVISTTSVATGNAVTHNGLVKVGNEAWLIGGRVGDHPGVVTNKVWIFNLNTRKWREGPRMPMPVAGGGAALVDGRIHWFGGLDPFAQCDVPFHYVYDLSNRAAGWKNITSAAAMPTPRNHFSTVVLNNKIYAIGGQFGHDACPGKSSADTNLVHVFNPRNNKWTKLASIPIKQSHAEPSTFAYQGDIYLVGGEGQGDKVFKYDPGKNKWSQFLTLPERLLAPVARVINDRLIVAGGGAPTTVVPVTTVRSIAFPGSASAESADDTSAGSIAGNTPTPPVTPQISEPEETPVPATQPSQTEEEPETPPQTVNIETSAAAVEQTVIEAPAPLPQLPPDFQAVLVAVEAENFTASFAAGSHEWKNVSLSGAVGSGALAALPDTGELTESKQNSPSLTYLLDIERAGTYYVWVRGWGDAGGKSNSLHVGLNDRIVASADKLQGFSAGWKWSNATRDGDRASINIDNVGLHSVSLWMREDGLAVDRFILTNDPAYMPSGNGPAATASGMPDGTAVVESAGPNPSSVMVEGNVISWTNDGWYQVLDAVTFQQVCGGGSSCEVGNGEYIVINHSSGERFDGISVVAADAGQIGPMQNDRSFVVEGDRIRVVNDDWVQVQEKDTYQTVCNGLTVCTPGTGLFTVINHSTGTRYENISVGVSSSLAGNSAADHEAGWFSINGSAVEGNGLDWLQVQRLPEYESVCEGREGCLLLPGSYIVINHSRGLRSEPVVIAN